MFRKAVYLYLLILLSMTAGRAWAGLPVSNGLVLHYDADAIVGLDDGDAVCTWNDSSGSGNHGTGIGGPTYHTGIINGRPIVRLDGSNDTFSSPLSSSQDMSIFVVTKGQQYYSLVRWQPGSWFVYYWAGGILIQTENGYLDGPDTGLVTNQWNIGAVLVDTGPADGVNTYRNGAVQGTTTYSSSWGPLPGLYIGSFSAGAGGNKEYTKGDIAEVLIYNRALSAPEHNLVGAYLTLKYAISTTYDTSELEPSASVPNPGNGEEDVCWQPTLNWVPDGNADSHDVYFGTDFGDVNDANSTNHLNVDYNNVDVNYYQPGVLQEGRKYYWRVDEVNQPDVWKGQVWNFVTDPGTARSPSPASGKKSVEPEPTLAWEPGPCPASHDVYLGTDFNDVNDANSISHSNVDYNNVDINSYQPGTLALGQKYYWRVDEVNEPNVWGGDVWNFTVTLKDPALASEPEPVYFGEGVGPNDVTLSWKPGVYAATHDVYFGTGFDEVNDAELSCLVGDIDKSRYVDYYDIYLMGLQWLAGPNENLSADLDDNNDVDFADFSILAGNWGQRAGGNQDANSFGLGDLTADETYYWRIDEVNGPNVSRGPVWSFTCCEYSLDFGLKAPTHLYIISTGTNQESILLQTLQGIVAQRKPELYFDFGLDSMGWVYDIQKKYGIDYTFVDSIRGSTPMVEWCLDNWADDVNGYVLYDYSDKDSITAATCMAGPLKAVAVDISLESRVQALGFSKLLDVRGLDDEWVYNNYRDRFIDNAIIVQDTQYLANRDWGPAIRALTVWNDSASFTHTAYSSITDNSPCFGWNDGYGGGELGAVQYHSQHSLYCGVSALLWNLSTHAGMASYEPPIEFEQKIRDNQYTPEDNVHYVAFHMSDGDNTRWQFNYTSYATTDTRWFGSPLRGTFAMGWGVPLEMVKLGPHVMKWYYNNMTEMDNFIGYGSGMGYSYPNHTR